MERYPNHEALVFRDDRWTYAQWNSRVNRLAHGLAALGVRSFDRVGLYLSTNEASVTTYFACQKLGAMAVPMNFRLSAGEVRYILQDSGARVRVYSSTYTDNVRLAAKGLRSVHDYICVAPDDEAALPENHYDFERLVGATNVVAGRFEALSALKTIPDERITTLFAVPTQIQDMLFHPEFKAFDLSSLRMITTGGAAMTAATMERVLIEFCPHLFNGYGMTEASLTLLLHPRDALHRLGSCGKSTIISSTRIIGVDSGREFRPDEIVGPNEIGQLVVRGPQMMTGYWNNPRESNKKLKYGWLYTGDLFSRDADGYN